MSFQYQHYMPNDKEYFEEKERRAIHERLIEAVTKEVQLMVREAFEAGKKAAKKETS